MNTSHSGPDHGTPYKLTAHKAAAPWWERLGGNALSIAIGLAALMLVIFAAWWFALPEKPSPAPDFMPPGGRGGPRGVSAKVENKHQRQIMPNTQVKRVVADGVASAVQIPDPGDMFGELSPLPSIAGGGTPGGSGVGRIGPGLGNNMPGPGTGISATATGLRDVFGMTDPSDGMLEGVFFDLKQTRKRESTGMTVQDAPDVIRGFIDKGWNDRSFSKYYKAGRTLYQDRIYMPVMKADLAPAAFGCASEVQPSRWVVVYRGMVTPPETGRYRFVGAGDDVLVVRFDNREVLDHGYTSGTTGIRINGNMPFFKGLAENDNLKKLVRRRYPMKLPVTYYEYPGTANWNAAIGGLAAGREFEAVAGRPYPIEILISEIPGGLFCAALMIEKVGETYTKAATGAPILPLFRLDANLPEVRSGAGNAPPFDPDGPVWKRVKGRISGGI